MDGERAAPKHGAKRVKEKEHLYAIWRRLNLAPLERPSIEDREIELSSRLIVKEKAEDGGRLIINMEAERKTS